MKGLLYIIIFVFLIVMAYAVPGIPCDFYGSVTINGESAPKGTIVTAYINGVRYGTFTVIKAGKYGLLSVQGDDKDTSMKDGGVNGDLVSFKVNGKNVKEQGVWKMGESVRVDLTLGKQGNTNVVMQTESKNSQSNLTNSNLTSNSTNNNLTSNSPEKDGSEKPGNKTLKGVNKNTLSEKADGNKKENATVHKVKSNQGIIIGIVIAAVFIIAAISFIMIKKRGI